MLLFNRGRHYTPKSGHYPIGFRESILLMPTRKHVEDLVEKNISFTESEYNPIENYNRVKHFTKLLAASIILNDELDDFGRLFGRIKSNHTHIPSYLFFHAIEELLNDEIIFLVGSTIQIQNEEILKGLSDDYFILYSLMDGRYPTIEVFDEDTKTLFKINNDNFGIWFQDLIQICELFKIRQFLNSNASHLHLFCSSSAGWLSWQVRNHIEKNEVPVLGNPTLLTMLENIASVPTFFVNHAKLLLNELDNESKEFDIDGLLNLTRAIRSALETTEEETLSLSIDEKYDFWQVMTHITNNRILVDSYDEETRVILCSVPEPKSTVPSD